jgi:carbon storage regulator
MLVLSRKTNETLVIDGRITVTVLEIQGGRVRLAIEAPGEVPVHRQEIFDKICRQDQPSRRFEAEQFEPELVAACGEL